MKPEQALRKITPAQEEALISLKRNSDKHIYRVYNARLSTMKALAKRGLVVGWGTYVTKSTFINDGGEKLSWRNKSPVPSFEWDTTNLGEGVLKLIHIRRKMAGQEKVLA